MLYALFGWMHAVASRRARAIANKIKQAVNAGRENAGEARSVAGIASGFAGPQAAHWSSRSSPQLLAASDEDVRSLFGAFHPACAIRSSVGLSLARESDSDGQARYPSRYGSGRPCTRLRNSCRVLESSLIEPRRAEVTVREPAFCTPRKDMQRCSASMITPTPRGDSSASSQSATWVVSRSWT